jgi:hypothetical protein
MQSVAKQEVAPQPPVKLRVDHITIAVSELQPMRRALGWQGLRSEYGGKHSNGKTEMAIIGLPDGSYIEIAAPIKKGDPDLALWKDFFHKDGGFCAWAVRSDKVAADLDRFKSAGIPVMGPIPGGRTKSDGTKVEWQLGFLTDKMPWDANLPFFIEDVTPRTNRVQVMPELRASYLKGAAFVILGVKDIPKRAKALRKAFHWPEPIRQEDAAFGAKLAHFPDTPVILAAPMSDDGWLAQRIKQFGEAPCGALITTLDVQVATDGLGLDTVSTWFGRTVMWFKPRHVKGLRLGFTE